MKSTKKHVLALVLALALALAFPINAIAYSSRTIEGTPYIAYADQQGTTYKNSEQWGFYHYGGSVSYANTWGFTPIHFTMQRDPLHVSTAYDEEVDSVLTDSNLGTVCWQYTIPQIEFEIPASEPNGVFVMWAEVEGAYGIWGVSPINGSAIEYGEIDFAPIPDSFELRSTIEYT